MEVSVRRIYSRMDQNEMALVFRGRKWANCVVVDYPIKVYTMDLREADKLEIPQFKGEPYPTKRMADSLLTLSKKNGITVAAERLVRAALDGAHLSEEIIDAKPSENGAGPDAEKKPRKTRAAKKKIAEHSEAIAKADPPREKVPRKPAGEGIVAQFSAKFKLEPKDARKLLRKAGLHAPYNDAAKVEEVLSKGKKK